jgi:Transposase, Mutator family
LRRRAIPISGRHLPEGPLGDEGEQHGAVGLRRVDEEGFREVLAVEVAGTEKGAAYDASLQRGLIDRGLRGVRLVVSDDQRG